MILLLGNQILLAQNISFEDSKDFSATSKERIFMHSNTSTCVTGETVFYKIYCLNDENNKASLISKIAYVELIASDKTTVVKQKNYLENGTSNGDIFIPTNLKTGNYKLISYTKWMLNTSDFFEMDINIINPYQPLPYEKNSDLTTSIEDTILPESEKVSSQNIENILSIFVNKKIFNEREKVTLKIKPITGNNLRGNYSISVRKIDNLPTNHQISATEFSSYAFQNKSRKLSKKSIFIPELRGELISGTLISKKGSIDLNHKMVALSIPGKSFAFKIVETDKSGKFTFILDKNPNLTQIVVQVMEENFNDYSIQLDDFNSLDSADLHFLSKLKLTSNHKKAIEEQSVANQIENAYYTQKKDSILPEVASNSFFNSLEKVYVLDDYTRFPSLKETITEVILELYFIKQNNKYSIHLRNNTLNAEIYGQPLVLVDGLLIQDTNTLFDYDTNNIYSISLINEPYVYGPKTFSGVINITTKTQEYRTKLSGDFIKQLDVLRPLNNKKYFSPDYSLTNSLNRIPDFRTQLLWAPELLKTNPEGEISFYTSDISGTFEIILEGFTDSEVPISIKELFEVN